jgi:hypothetical protein
MQMNPWVACQHEVFKKIKKIEFNAREFYPAHLSQTVANVFELELLTGHIGIWLSITPHKN